LCGADEQFLASVVVVLQQLLPAQQEPVNTISGLEMLVNAALKATSVCLVAAEEELRTLEAKQGLKSYLVAVEEELSALEAEQVALPAHGL